MIKANINLDERSYPIYITTDFEGLGKAVADAGINGKALIITDKNVDSIYREETAARLSEAGYQVFHHVIEPGEKSKNLDTVKEIYKLMHSLNMDRRSAVIALGGGVVGDIAGFAAATYLRGIDYVQIPTSLLAQADSSVGGKVGVDFENAKNIIGAFYQPRMVYINVNTLKTLPKRELVAGAAEVIKHAVIMDREFFEYLDANINRLLDCDENVMMYVARMNCGIKGHVVEKDEKESGLRSILNFGHTIGHALESASEFKLLHGECVAVGMVGAFKLALRLGMVSETEAGTVESLLLRAGLPTKLKGLNPARVYEAMLHDKKKREGKLVFILPKSIGKMVKLTLDDEEMLKGVLDILIN
jgi:3-dehydroquinate synthase